MAHFTGLSRVARGRIVTKAFAGHATDTMIRLPAVRAQGKILRIAHEGSSNLYAARGDIFATRRGYAQLGFSSGKRRTRTAGIAASYFKGTIKDTASALRPDRGRAARVRAQYQGRTIPPLGQTVRDTRAEWKKMTRNALGDSMFHYEQLGMNNVAAMLRSRSKAFPRASRFGKIALGAGIAGGVAYGINRHYKRNPQSVKATRGKLVRSGKQQLKLRGSGTNKIAHSQYRRYDKARSIARNPSSQRPSTKRLAQAGAAYGASKAVRVGSRKIRTRRDSRGRYAGSY